MAKHTNKSAAVLTIKRAPAMTKKGRKDIAAWLRRQANMLLRHGDQYSETRFTARYLYR
jgi:hypothetical protein